MKVLHLPTATGGFAWGLAQGERKLGLDSDVLVISDSWLRYPCDINLDLERLSRMGKWSALFSAFMKYRKSHDVFHFNYGSSLIDIPQYGLSLADLPFYPKKKKIVMTYNGCDARQKHKTMSRVPFSPCHNECCYDGACNDIEVERRKERRIAKASRYADHIFAVNPDLMWFLPQEKTTFLPYAIAEWENIPSLRYAPGKRITVVHAPTNRAAKGTAYILPALSNLQKRHENIVIRVVENIPNKEAIGIYRSSDIVVDQVLAGWYGGFAVEAMRMGKPVAVYIREEDLRFVPPAMANDLLDAVINITPFNIETVLEEYLQGTDPLRRKSEAAREYVAKWHDPAFVAGITKSVYEA